jgi:O-acetyl-ADP-ribose deacetylase (regulator of RNase III)
MKIQLIKGDITKIDVDAIVNAANTRLMGGGGVDGAIHKAGGPAIMRECDVIREKFGGCPTGKAVITTAGNLPAKHVIHTVGPVWRGGHQHEPDLLKDAYRNSLSIAEEHHLKSIAFPNISTGVYGFPIEDAADIAIETVIKYMEQHTIIEAVTFVCFDTISYVIYREKLQRFGFC